MSSLIAVTDSRSAAVYRHVASRLDRPLPPATGDIRTHWQTEVLRLHQLYRHR